ncbi:MAG TPA: relaxase/mobilization nuclease domain-containing protein [Puia sp.]|uniref:relaxase/mobilization nuclease domain-containing protein n=1 Tax=Puia sp. TaxID=2045100 RepID=UPI002BAFB7A2|nr:relaxase/mobilization nuclease domain-containing protein [Puia sp.]HVU94882.1 relaxase/mobilization nuclease domain-containing protein [Puia sp.]
MIAKTFITAKGFGETCSYLCEDLTRAQVLAAEGVRAHDVKLMAADFQWQHALMPEKEKPVYHSVLSFPMGEKVDDKRLVELGRRYLEKIGMENTQYALVKHTDTEHLHVHVLANRVDNDGQPTGKGLIIERGIKAARELTDEYGLTPDGGKRLDRTHREALHEPDAKRYRIYEAIREVLPRCRELEDLEKELMQKGIAVRYRYAESGERQGISFRTENCSFKGSRVDKEYSLKGLERTLDLQEALRQQPELFEGRALDERLRLMRDPSLRAKEEERVVEMKRQEELRQERAFQLRSGALEDEERHLTQRMSRGLRL